MSGDVQVMSEDISERSRAILTKWELCFLGGIFPGVFPGVYLKVESQTKEGWVIPVENVRGSACRTLEAPSWCSWRKAMFRRGMSGKCSRGDQRRCLEKNIGLDLRGLQSKREQGRR